VQKIKKKTRQLRRRGPTEEDVRGNFKRRDFDMTWVKQRKCGGDKVPERSNWFVEQGTLEIRRTPPREGAEKG